VLELEGYIVHAHGSARTALASVRASTPDLLIVELSLPDMTGAAMIRELRASGIDIPAMILSASAEETDKMVGFRAGADDYVAKPCSLMELLARIAALLARSGRSA
jgi:two-component system OmpR family response regulator